MDIELLRTFLEVNRTRHFAMAAEHLYVTQAAVSARVRLLEDIVGAKLFTRTRNDIQLTSTGHRLLPHAEAMLNAWNRALLETGARDESRQLVALGCLPSLWEIYFQSWLAQIYRDVANVLLQVEQLTSTVLIQRVREQSLSLGVLYEPPQAADLAVQQVSTVELVLVSTTPGLSVKQALPDYVYVDWGTAFAMSHNAVIPELPIPVLRVDTASLAYEFLAEQGGTAYLARRRVEADLASGRLHLVGSAPVLDRPVYLVRSATMPHSDATETVAHAIRNRVAAA